MHLTPELTEYAVRRARFKAKRLAKKMPSLGDYEDIQQDLLLDLLERIQKFDPTKAGEKTFICRIINHKISDIVRKNRCAGDLSGISCDDWINDETGEKVRRDVMIDEDRSRAHRGIDLRADLDHVQLKMDTEQVFRKLAPTQRRMCQRLSCQSPMDAAGAMGVSMSTFYRHMAMIRTIFLQADLHLHL